MRYATLLPRLAALLLLTAPAAQVAAQRAEKNDDLVVVVSAKSMITEIPRLHLADLYLGRTTRFPNGAAAVPVDQRTGSTDRALFSRVYLGRTEAQLKAHWSKIIFTGRGRPPAEAPSGEAVKEALLANPHAIGYIDRQLVDASVRVVRVL